MTELDVRDMTAAEAIVSVEIARTHLEAAADEIVRQINGRAWLSLGFSSWDEMRTAKYGGAAVIVPREDRPELVARLRREGLTQAQIGDTVGVSRETVRTDLSTPGLGIDAPATITTARGQTRPATYAPADAESRRQARERAEAEATREHHARELARIVWTLAERAGRDDAVGFEIAEWIPEQDIYPVPTTGARIADAAAYLLALSERWPVR